MRKKETLKQKRIRELYTLLRLKANAQGNTDLNGVEIAKLFGASIPTVSVYIRDLIRQRKIYRITPNGTVFITLTQRTTPMVHDVKRTPPIKLPDVEKPLIHQLDRLIEQDRFHILEGKMIADLKEWEKTEEEYLESFMRTIVNQELRKQTKWKVSVIFLCLFILGAFIAVLFLRK